MDQKVYELVPVWDYVLLFLALVYLSLSLLLASVLPKLSHNWVAEFQSWSLGKERIRLCP